MNKFLGFLLFSAFFTLVGSRQGLAGQDSGPTASVQDYGGGLPGFTVRESETAGKNIELVALDENGNILPELEGAHPFSVNGFETEVKFADGRAGFAREVSSSTFLYIKYKGKIAAEGAAGAAPVSELFYVYRGLTGDYTVIHIPLALLVIIPLALILLGVFFRRLIIIAVVLLGAFFYFNSVKGLSLESFFDAAKEWISGLF